ncbi:MAG: serine hydrolase [Clostridia bacterium]|nr:serine hydrolase [Clostridia bacterium]
MNLQLIQLREAHEAVLAENEVLIQENSRLDERIEEMLAQITSMDNELDERDAVISEMDVLLEEIQTEIAAREAEAEKLEQELAELEHKNEVNLLVTERLRESRNQALSSAEELKRKMEVLIRESEQRTEESAAETEPDVPDVSEEPEVPLRTEAEQMLFDLLETGAPPRYVKNEDGSIYSEYPHLEYAYYDFTTGRSVTYHSDEIIYSASVIKAPFVYAVIREIEDFEKNKRDFDSDGNPLWDAEGNPLFEDSHPNYNADGTLIYLPGEEKYNLDEIWTFDPETMMEEGSGEIMNQSAGFQLTWRELIEYALLYSDNIAFAQIRQRFGYNSFYQLVAELGVQGTATGFMNLSADDCVKFLTVMHDYMAAGSDYALWMKDCMTRSKHLVILARHYPEGTCAHKYGWDIDAYHDAAVIFDEHPYALVVMSNLHDGGDTVNAYFGEIVDATKRIHAEEYPEE